MKKILLLILLSVLLIAEQNQTEELSFFDKEDGKLDLSEYLSTAYGFLPVPIVITEPAVGYGAGLSLVYLHDNFTGQKLDSGRVVPASMSGAFYMKTENGTNMGGAFHVGYYFEDNLRTISFVGI
ncbi:MAG: glyceraldehyde-3-phosphate dehydrogenase, partial [Epsilonproteobacteria bacterium]